MAKLPRSHPVFVKEAKGARLTDIDGHTATIKNLRAEMINS